MIALVTGGAGFIGSNLVRSLVAAGNQVRVLDNLSTGSLRNLTEVKASIEMIVGDLRHSESLGRAVEGVEVVYHLAALPSVVRSIEDPIASSATNAEGTLRLLMAARGAGVRRVVYASSSSVYGDTPSLPKHEEMPVSPRSPYAASKLAGEAYCRAFTATFGLETVSLRFFNVFGSRQDPRSEYAAVVPRFIEALLEGRPPTIYGDGTQTRDFTYVANVVQACVLAAEAPTTAAGEAFNIGCQQRISLLQLVDMLGELIGRQVEPVFSAARSGDVMHSEASISKAGRLLGFRPLVGVRQGLHETIEWTIQNNELVSRAG